MQVAKDLLPPPHKSWNSVIATLDPGDQEKIIGLLSDDQTVAASTDWFLQARREQMPPDWDWTVWLMMAGRGFGKNWGGSHWLINSHIAGEAKNSGIVAATASDLRRYCLEGPSGILSLAPPWFRPDYQPSKSKLVWPDKAETLLFTSEKPDRLRGPNLDKVLCDELAAWKYLDETWQMLQLCLRHGDMPQAVVTTTPRPKLVLRELLKREGKDVAVTRGSTYDNAANLPERFLKEIIEQYKGTRLERQEIYGDLLDEFEGALWSYNILDRTRVNEHPILHRIGVGVDPAISSEEGSDLTGIVAAGLGPAIPGGIGKHGYVLSDHTLRASPENWARKAITVYHTLQADIIVAEANQGGEMVEATIKAVDDTVNVKLVHASRAKVTRAEPIAAYYEQNRVHHVGTIPELEDQMCLFLPGERKKSPDRVDALVWVLTELMGGMNQVPPSIRAIH